MKAATLLQPEVARDVGCLVEGVESLKCGRCPQRRAAAAPCRRSGKAACLRCLRLVVYSASKHVECQCQACTPEPTTSAGHEKSLEQAALAAVLNSGSAYQVAKATGARRWTSHALLTSAPPAGQEPDDRWSAFVRYSEALDNSKLPHPESETWTLA